MKSINWKKSLVCCVSFLAVFFGEVAVNIACGPEQDPYDYYVSYFHNNVQGDEYEAFAFNEMVYLYKNEEFESEPEINSAEWANFLNIKKEDVFKVMYNRDSLTNIKLVNLSIQSINNLPDSLKQNSYVKAMAKNEEALKYFNFAKSCEPLATSDFDPWNPVQRDSVAMIKKAEEAIRFAAIEKQDFLKLRYAYQATRMFHYAGKYEDCKITYEKYVEPNKIKSAVNGWALALYAGAVRYSGNPDRAAYLFAKVFASNPERRVQAYKNYFYTSAPIENVLKHAKNDTEKAAVWAIEGFGTSSPNLESLQNVYEYQPKSLLTGALLVREVNKLEQNLIKESDIAKNSFARYFARYGDDGKTIDSAKDANLKHLIQLKEFALKLANDKKYPQAELGTITAAYLSWMQNKPAAGVAYLAGIKNVDKLPERYRDQVRIIQLLCESTKIKKGENFNENNLLPALKWLDEKRYAENKPQPTAQDYYDDWANGENRFTITTRNFYQQILAPAYLKMGDTAKAALALVKGDLKYSSLKNNSLFKNISYQTTTFWQQSLSPKTMQDLAKFKTRPKADDVESLLASALNKLANNDFYELYGTTYLRTHNYAKAIECFNKISAGYKYFTPSNWYGNNEDNKLYANSFTETINDYPKKYGKMQTGINKKTFAQEMLRLQKLALNDKKNASLYYYKMANGIYQTGYYGNSWFLISYDWSSYDLYGPPQTLYDNDYKLATTAKAFYNKAKLLSSDANFKAKCTFMLAKCEQKKIINTSYGNVYNYDENYEVTRNKFMAANFNNPYFKELKAKYAITPFYKIAVNQCSYFKEFLRPTKSIKPKPQKVIIVEKGK